MKLVQPEGMIRKAVGIAPAGAVLRQAGREAGGHLPTHCRKDRSAICAGWWTQNICTINGTDRSLTDSEVNSGTLAWSEPAFLCALSNLRRAAGIIIV